MDNSGKTRFKREYKACKDKPAGGWVALRDKAIKDGTFNNKDVKVKDVKVKHEDA